MKYYLVIIALGFTLVGCSKPDAQTIVDKSIAFYNMEKLQNATLEFSFRKFKFIATQKEGKFTYERMFNDSTGYVHDLLSNDGFERFVNNKKVNLNAEDAKKYTESVNASIYFLYQPLKLNDASVTKKYLGETRIKDKNYYKIEVAFKQQGGGVHYDDVFYYWFDKEDYSMDHFAYSAGGNRFRSVLKTHQVGDVVFQDYINYQSPLGDSVTPLIKYDSLYNAGKLRELSRIEFGSLVLK
jgi:hypothetical protein